MVYARDVANNFAAWVKRERAELGISQAELARRVQRRMREKYKNPELDWGRDKINKMEIGSPEMPDPEIVTFIAEGLNRPLREALEALGYGIPVNINEQVSPALGKALEGITWETQERLAAVLPSLLGLAGQLVGAATSEPEILSLEEVDRRNLIREWNDYLHTKGNDQLRVGLQEARDNEAPDLKRLKPPPLSPSISRTVAS